MYIYICMSSSLKGVSVFGIPNESFGGPAFPAVPPGYVWADGWRCAEGHIGQAEYRCSASEKKRSGKCLESASKRCLKGVLSKTSKRFERLSFEGFERNCVSPAWQRCTTTASPGPRSPAAPPWPGGPGAITSQLQGVLSYRQV